MRCNSIGGEVILDEEAIFPTLKAFRGKENQNMRFIISKYNISHDAILGNDNLIQMGAVINLRDMTIEINDVKHQFYLSTEMESEMEKYHNVVCNQISELRGMSENDEEANINNVRADHLNAEERKKLMGLLKEFTCLFYNKEKQLSTANLPIMHNIRLTTDKPVQAVSYRYPQIHEEEVERQIQEMINQGIIRKSNSPYNAPIWIVDKKSDASGVKKFRLVVDYRKLNEVTVEEKFPIPTIDDALSKLGNSMYFTTLDLAKGYYQVKVNPDDIFKTAFTAGRGKYEFLRMPMG